MITITDTAQDEVNRLLTKRGTPSAYVRFGVRGGGCYGFNYVFEFVDEADDTDTRFGNVLVDPKSMRLVEGTIIDFVPGIRGHGFKFQNPNVTTNCGCGESITF